ncbi:peptidoglycan-binding domain-containing protein, partial [Xanthobacter sp. DSM 24535]|uniref:peptidoglycan-binding domain-containing protein n=1 Tax=Roseixanthobacter psychrophilus TaxID=3119917 RepID=UPI003728B0DD
DLGYTGVGMVDGRIGSKTVGALSSFQADNGLTVDGLYGPETKAKLADPDTPRREIGLQRATATAADLRAAGSGTVKTADQISFGAKALVALGLGGVGQQTGVLDGAKQALDTASAVRPLVDSAAGLLSWASANWSMLAVLAGGAGIYLGGKIVARRVEQFRADRNV